MDDDYYDDDSDWLADEFRNDHHLGFNDDDDAEWLKKHGSRSHSDLNGYIRYLMSHSDLHKHLAHVTSS